MDINYKKISWMCLKCFFIFLLGFFSGWIVPFLMIRYLRVLYPDTIHIVFGAISCAIFCIPPIFLFIVHLFGVNFSLLLRVFCWAISLGGAWNFFTGLSEKWMFLYR